MSYAILSTCLKRDSAISPFLNKRPWIPLCIDGAALLVIASISALILAGFILPHGVGTLGNFLAWGGIVGTVFCLLVDSTCLFLRKKKEAPQEEKPPCPVAPLTPAAPVDLDSLCLLEPVAAPSSLSISCLEREYESQSQLFYRLGAKCEEEMCSLDAEIRSIGYISAKETLEEARKKVKLRLDVFQNRFNSLGEGQYASELIFKLTQFLLDETLTEENWQNDPGLRESVQKLFSDSHVEFLNTFKERLERPRIALLNGLLNKYGPIFPKNADCPVTQESGWFFFRGGVSGFHPGILRNQHKILLTKLEDEKKLGRLQSEMKWLENLLAQSLGNEYKIHLMPKGEFIFATVEHLLEAISNDPELKDSVFSIKVSRSVTINIDPDAPPAPVIVIYVKSRKKCAQTALNRLFFHFKGYFQWGIGLCPRFNLPGKNGLIYYAQGDSYEKACTIDSGFDSIVYDPDRVHFNKRFGQFKLTLPEGY